MKTRLLRAAISKLRAEGPTALARDGVGYLRKEVRNRRHPYNRRYRNSLALLNRHELNLCHNNSIPEDYDPDAKNVLLAIESPGVVEYEGWLDDSMEFVAEISFGNFYDLDRYYCPRTLYVTNDNFVDLDMSCDYNDKEALVSLVYSKSDHLPGHVLRHEIADEFGSGLDIYGSGAGEFTDRFWSDVHQTYLERKASSLANHMFQIVIENVQHDRYVSEKFFDALKTNTVPIYRGGEQSVRKMGFDTDGIIFFNTVADLRDVLSDLSTERYQEMRPAAERNRKRLVEIRRQNRFQFLLDTIKPGYMHSVDSYHHYDYDSLTLDFDE